MPNEKITNLIDKCLKDDFFQIIRRNQVMKKRGKSDKPFAFRVHFDLRITPNRSES